MQVGRVDEHIAATDLEQLQSNREFLALPRFCVEVLQSSKEEVDAVKPQVCVCDLTSFSNLMLISSVSSTTFII